MNKYCEPSFQTSHGIGGHSYPIGSLTVGHVGRQNPGASGVIGPKV